MVRRRRKAREACNGRGFHCALAAYSAPVRTRVTGFYGRKRRARPPRQQQRRISNTLKLRSRSRTDGLDRNDYAVSQIYVLVLIAVNVLIENHAFFFSVVDLVGLAPARRFYLLG
jgi:hypothetical protein